MLDLGQVYSSQEVRTYHLYMLPDLHISNLSPSKFQKHKLRGL